MKSTYFFILAVLIFVLNATVVSGQDKFVLPKKTSNTEKKEKKETEKENDGQQTYFLLYDMSANVGIGRGFTLNLGAKLQPGEGAPAQYMSLNFSIPVVQGGHTAVGAYYKIYPFNGKFGKFLSIGLDFEYFFRSDLKGYSEFFFGGKLSNTVKGPGVQWEARRLVLAPRIDFLVPIGNWKIGLTTNPLMFGYWNFDPTQKKWGSTLRWYDASITIQKTFGTKKCKKYFQDKEDAKNAARVPPKS